MSKFSIIATKTVENPAVETYQVYSDGKPVGPVHPSRESANAYKRKLEKEAEDTLGW